MHPLKEIFGVGIINDLIILVFAQVEFHVLTLTIAR